MKTTDLDALYAGIQSAQEKKDTANQGPRDILRLKPSVDGTTYLLALVPFMKDLSKTFVEYDFHGWTSVTSGKYVTTGACPRKYGGVCPVCRTGYAAYEAKEMYKGNLKSKLLLNQTTRLVNVYVIDDPAEPSNNGTVKALRYRQQLHDVIYGGVSGEDKEEVGKKAFDLSPDGQILRIVAQKKNEQSLPSYTKTKFVKAGENIDLTEDRVSEIRAQALDLTELIPKTLSDGEIEAVLEEHFHGNKPQEIGNDPLPGEQGSSIVDEIVTSTTPTPKSSAPTGIVDQEDEIAKLLEGIETT